MPNILRIYRPIVHMPDDSLANFSQNYLKTVLSVGRLLPNYIIYYYGPREIADNIIRKPNPSRLLETVGALRKFIPSSYGDLQRIFLEKHLISLQRTLKSILGEEVGFKELVAELYDIRPSKVPEAQLQNSRSELSELFGKQNMAGG